MMIIDTKEGINLYMLVALKQALKLEIAGMKFGGRSRASHVRHILGSTTRSKKKLLTELEVYIEGIKSQLGRAN